MVALLAITKVTNNENRDFIRITNITRCKSVFSKHWFNNDIIIYGNDTAFSSKLLNSHHIVLYPERGSVNKYSSKFYITGVEQVERRKNNVFNYKYTKI